MTRRPESSSRHDITITEGSTVATIDPLGAHVTHLSIGGAPVLKPTSDGKQTHGGIAVLIPYAGRVKEGRYVFEGKRFQLPTRSDGHAIHGFAKDVTWKVRSRTRRSASLGATVRGEGYPGTLTATITYSAKDGAFSTDCSVRNASNHDVPVVVGFHPYFTAQRWKIKSSGAAYHYELEDGYFPTGKRTRYSLQAVGPGSRLDDCFASTGTISLSTGGTLVTIHRRKMPYLVIYNGKYAEGRSVAVEPYSGLPDAYNSGIGLRTLPPGRAFECGYDIRVKLGHTT